MKKRIKMYGGSKPKPPKPKPSDKTKKPELGFWAKRKTRKLNESITKNSIHIAKKISKLEGKIETSKKKKAPGTYVSKKKQGEIYKLTEALGKLQLQSAEIHKDGVLRETQPPEPGKSTKALESPQTQSNNKTRQSAFQRGIENGISQKQFKSQEMYKSKQRYINSRKQSLSNESQILVAKAEQLKQEIEAEIAAEKTKPQGEPKKPGFFSKISSLFKMKKKTKQNKLNNIQAKLTKLKQTQNSVDKYKEEQNKAYTAKQSNYTRRLDILKTIPTAKAQESTKVLPLSKKEKKKIINQAKIKVEDTKKKVIQAEKNLKDANQKVNDVETLLSESTTKSQNFSKNLIQTTSEIEINTNRINKINEERNALIKDVHYEVKGKTELESFNIKREKLTSLWNEQVSLLIANRGKEKSKEEIDAELTKETFKQVDLKNNLNIATTEAAKAQTDNNEAQNLHTQAKQDFIEVSTTTKQKEKIKAEQEAENKKTEQEEAKIKTEQEAAIIKAKAIENAVKLKAKAEEDAKLKAEEFNKSKPGLETKLNELYKNLEELKSKKIEAEKEFEVAKKKKSDADTIVSNNTEKLNTMINDEKEIFKKKFIEKYATLDGPEYLKDETEHITKFKSSTDEIVTLSNNLKKYKANAIEQKKIYEQKTKDKFDYLVQIRTTKKELASLDEQIKNFNVNTQSNAG